MTKRDGSFELVSKDERIKVRVEYAEEDDLPKAAEMADLVADWVNQAANEAEHST
jgi:hypothetical protein